MYLGYDKNGNIITKDPFGERGESTRSLLGANELTREEALGRFQKKIKASRYAAQEEKREKELAAQRARASFMAAKKAQIKALKNAQFLKGAEFSGSGQIYTQMGGLYGDALTPHHVSGEVIANTFKSDYGLNGADFGHGQMGFSFTTDKTKQTIRETYEEMLRVEKGLKDMTDAMSILEKAGKKNTPIYANLKKVYDIAYNRYQNTPVSYKDKKYASRRQAGIELGLKLRDAVAKKDPQGAKNLALMFAAPISYEQQVKSGAIKSFSGYGFGSEFDDEGMGFIPLLGLAAWQVAAAALGTAAVSGAAYAVLSKDKVLDDALASSKSLIEQALKEGKTELATQLIKREETLLKQKEKQSEGVVEKTEKLVGVAGSGVKIAAGVIALIVFWKIGLPLLQSKTAPKVSA
jgi:hypothetical protein